MTTPQDPAQVNQALKITQVTACLDNILGSSPSAALVAFCMALPQSWLNRYASQNGIATVPVVGQAEND
jgi:hypothetical protein